MLKPQLPSDLVAGCVLEEQDPPPTLQGYLAGEELRNGAARNPCYLIVHNVSKKHNVGTLARTATAFAVSEVLLVGERSYNTFGSQGAADYVTFRHFPTLLDVRRYLVEEKNAEVLGVEIVQGAQPVNEHPFRGPTAFIMGNEGAGLSKQQMAICDGFVYIPQYGPGTASLNVAVAAAIILHRFAAWAGYRERAREGGKFEVAERPMRTTPRGYVGDGGPEETRLARAAARAGADAFELGDDDGGGVSGLLLEDGGDGDDDGMTMRMRPA